MKAPANSIVMNIGDTNGMTPQPENMDEIRQAKKQVSRFIAPVWKIRF